VSPSAARRCNLICPASADGKKVLAEPGKQARRTNAKSQKDEWEKHPLRKTFLKEPPDTRAEVFETIVRNSPATAPEDSGLQGILRRLFLVSMQQEPSHGGH